MTVSTTTTRTTYTSTGGTTYPFVYAYNAGSDLAVYVDGVQQTYNADYSVDESGNVVFAVAPTAGATVLIVRAEPDTQATDLTYVGPYTEEAIEAMADKRTRLSQQLTEALDRTLRFPVYSGSSGGVLPTPELNKAMRWSAVSPPTLQNYTITEDPAGLALPLTQANGGLGVDTSAWSGWPYLTAGTWSAVPTAGIPHQYGGALVPSQDYLTPQMFGAVADYDPDTGLGTDNAEAFQAWIDAVAATRMIGICPPGDYGYDASVVLKGSYRCLRCYGAHWYFRDTTPTDYAITVLDATGNPQMFTLAGLNLHGNATCAGGINLGVSDAASAHGPYRLVDLYVDGFTNAVAGYGAALTTKYTIYVTLVNCQFRGNNYGWYADTETNSAVALNVSAVANAIAGFRLGNSYGITLLGGSAEQSDNYGVLITGQGSVTVDGTYFEANAVSEVSIGDASNAHVTHCRFNGAAPAAIQITGDTSGWTARDNYYLGTYDYFIQDKYTISTAYHRGKVDENHVNLDDLHKFYFNYYTDAELSGLFTETAGYVKGIQKRGTLLTVQTVGTAEPAFGTFDIGARYQIELPTSGNPAEYVCTVAGTAGTLSGVTGTIATGSTQLTVNDPTDLYLGCRITIVGVSDVKQVVGLSGSVATLDNVSDADVTDAGVAFSAPTWTAAASLA